ncbi:MAG: hypothetical protein NTV26_04905 [Caldiserica bacterium]|nr:hypothetical protein [Caldisericota bacterium]
MGLTMIKDRERPLPGRVQDNKRGGTSMDIVGIIIMLLFYALAAW